MKNFFEKHRHLIVIGLIGAVILTVCTALAIRAKMKQDLARMQEFQIVPRKQVVVELMPSHSSEVIWLFGANCKTQYYKKDLKQICKLLNEHVMERTSNQSTAENLCTVTFKDRNRDAEVYVLKHRRGNYYLSCVTQWGTWQISEQGTRELMAYIRCDHPTFEQSPRELLCDAQKIEAASITLPREREDPVTTALTAEQIEALCTFLSKHPFEVKTRRHYTVVLPVSAGGWSMDLCMEDGYTYRLQYLGPGQYRLLFGLVPEGENNPDSMCAYQLEEENPYANLPDLLEDAP